MTDYHHPKRRDIRLGGGFWQVVSERQDGPRVCIVNFVETAERGFFFKLTYDEMCQLREWLTARIVEGR